MPRKTAQKTALRKPSHGKGMLLTGGQPGNKGGPGRPKDEFKELCRQLASGEITIANLKSILADASHQQFLPALRYVTEHGYGKATETVDVTSQGEHVNKPQTVDWGALKLVV